MEGGESVLRTRRFIVALAVAIALALPAHARADDPPVTADGLGNVFRYSSCAAAVYVAITPGQWVAAFLACAALFQDAI
jgi:hypothetical protein